MLCSSVESNDEHSDASSANFYHIASASDEHSSLFHRDLPFLLDISIKMAEYNLALDIGETELSYVFYVYRSEHSNNFDYLLLQRLKCSQSLI